MIPALRQRGFRLIWARTALQGLTPIFLAAALLILPSFSQGAEPSSSFSTYPSGPLTLLVGAPTGHQPDLIFRLMPEEAKEFARLPLLLRQTPGRSGMYALRDVAALPADGLNLASWALPEAALQKSLPGIPFDPDSSRPVTLLASVPVALWTEKESPLRNLEDLVRMARQGPEQVRIAGPARGSDAHITARLFDRAAGVRCICLLPGRARF